jgi:hypothetical protein
MSGVVFNFLKKVLTRRRLEKVTPVERMYLDIILRLLFEEVSLFRICSGGLDPPLKVKTYHLWRYLRHHGSRLVGKGFFGTKPEYIRRRDDEAKLYVKLGESPAGLPVMFETGGARELVGLLQRQLAW